MGRRSASQEAASATVRSQGNPDGTLPIMRRTQHHDHTQRNTLKNLWRLALLIIGVIAVVQELQKPDGERTWHGKVGDLVPYDFRKPTVERFRQTYWNPEGPFLSSTAWGVGWALNIGALKKLISD